MPRGDQVARLYGVLTELGQAKRGVPAKTLAERQGCRARTIYRDLRALQQAGFPITCNEGLWRVVEGWQGAVPFPLTLGERYAVHVARSLMRPLDGTRIGRDFERVVHRIAGARRKRDRQQELFARVHDAVSTPSPLAIDYGRHAAILETLCSARERLQTVRVAYFVETRNELTHRDIDPYHIHYDPRLEAVYVFAWCHLRRDLRTFAVHRFRQVAVTQRHFRMPADFTPEDYLRGAFRLWRGRNAQTVRLRVDASIAGWIGERRWHASQKLKRGRDGSCELELLVDGTREVHRFILQLGASVDVLEPTSLREEIAAEHAAAARRAGIPPKESASLDDTRRNKTGGR